MYWSSMMLKPRTKSLPSSGVFVFVFRGTAHYKALLSSNQRGGFQRYCPQDEVREGPFVTMLQLMAHHLIVFLLFFVFFHQACVCVCFTVFVRLRSHSKYFSFYTLQDALHKGLVATVLQRRSPALSFLRSDPRRQQCKVFGKDEITYI